MEEVIPISEAKTNLSKLVKRAQAGETIYLGAYGRVQAVLGPVPSRRSVPIGIWAHRKIDDAYEYMSLVGPDDDITADFMASAEHLVHDGDQ